MLANHRQSVYTANLFRKSNRVERFRQHLLVYLRVSLQVMLHSVVTECFLQGGKATQAKITKVT